MGDYMHVIYFNSNRNTEREERERKKERERERESLTAKLPSHWKASLLSAKKTEKIFQKRMQNEKTWAQGHVESECSLILFHIQHL